jgi:hypothetical protein
MLDMAAFLPWSVLAPLIGAFTDKSEPIGSARHAAGKKATA